MFDQHVNLLIGTVQIPPTPSTTGGSLTLMPGDTRFRANMPVTITPPDVEPTHDNSEIAYLTEVDGLVLTLDRGQEDSNRMQIAAGWIVRGSLTAKTITDLEHALDGKVDQLAGKGLSTNDFDDAAESKLAGIASGATQNASVTLSAVRR
ncbi:hypothetical protein [Mycolicibacterium sp. PDY-3]|uniref:hypothetical protein n=1 Tax=Mycolicibacterium sp. PDY-3 TaxID=3376069 RepID=UPI0037967FEC